MSEYGTIELGNQPEVPEMALSYEEKVRISESHEVLSFENFLLAKHNFRQQFSEGLLVDTYWKQPIFAECLASCPSFVNIAIALLLRDDYFSEEYQKILYEAYVMMRPYAKTNWELFI